MGGFLVVVDALKSSYYMIGEQRFSSLCLGREAIEAAVREAGFSIEWFEVICQSYSSPPPKLWVISWGVGIHSHQALFLGALLCIPSLSLSLPSSLRLQGMHISKGKKCPFLHVLKRADHQT